MRNGQAKSKPPFLRFPVADTMTDYPYQDDGAYFSSAFNDLNLTKAIELDSLDAILTLVRNNESIESVDLGSDISSIGEYLNETVSFTNLLLGLETRLRRARITS